MAKEKSVWIVAGRTESGDDWELRFEGFEKPTENRINAVYAEVYPDEWDYMPEALITNIYEEGLLEAFPCEGPELEAGEER